MGVSHLYEQPVLASSSGSADHVGLDPVADPKRQASWWLIPKGRANSDQPATMLTGATSRGTRPRICAQ